MSWLRQFPARLGFPTVISDTTASNHRKFKGSFDWTIIKWIIYTGRDSAKHLTTQLT